MVQIQRSALLSLLFIVLRSARRRLLVGMLAPFVLIVFVYGKNLAHFGSFSASTWLGMHLARLVADTSP